jgi:hypothetical protein
MAARSGSAKRPITSSDQRLGDLGQEGEGRLKPFAGRDPSELGRIIAALNHPLRRQMLGVLVREPSSATALKKKLGGGSPKLSTVIYHLKEVREAVAGAAGGISVAEERSAERGQGNGLSLDCSIVALASFPADRRVGE